MVSTFVSRSFWVGLVYFWIMKSWEKWTRNGQVVSGVCMFQTKGQQRYMYTTIRNKSKIILPWLNTLISDKEGYWNHNQMTIQVEDAVECLSIKYRNKNVDFLFFNGPTKWSWSYEGWHIECKYDECKIWRKVVNIKKHDNPRCWYLQMDSWLWWWTVNVFFRRRWGHILPGPWRTKSLEIWLIDREGQDHPQDKETIVKRVEREGIIELPILHGWNSNMRNKFSPDGSHA